MKIIHSYWSKPAIKGGNHYDKIQGGWRHYKYHYMSWALSCLSFKKIYDKIELVTDQAGYELLIEKLKLPYSSVKIELDCLNHYPEKLWAIGKLYAYRLQSEPFIHVDGDVYIWEKFDKNLENAPLIAQHEDFDEIPYNTALQQLHSSNYKIPEILKKDLSISGKFRASNAGIIGGNDIDFFQQYVNQAFNFINSNLDKNISSLPGTSYALIYEQFLFSCLARSKKRAISHLFTEEEMRTQDISSFSNKYSNKKYVHLLANKKLFFEYCKELEAILKLEYPEYHERIINLVS